MPLADRLRQVRLERMLTQGELAALDKVHWTTIARTEGGDGMPNPSTIRALAQALGVHPTALVTPSEYAEKRTRRKATTVKGLQRAVNRNAARQAKAQVELQATESA